MEQHLEWKAGLPALGEQGRSCRVLVVDDDPGVVSSVRQALEREAFDVGTAASAHEAMSWMARNGLPNVAVVDIMMPGTSGLELCREVQKFADLPVILLTATREKSTVIQAINEVAEDYVTKPFDMDELVARVKRLLRRIGAFSFKQAPLTRIDEDLAVDFMQQKILIEGRAVSLTPTETKILHILIRSSPRTVTTDYLLDRVWPLEEVYEDTVRVHVHRLRQKIEPQPSSPRYLITQRGVGYSFRPGAG